MSIKIGRAKHNSKMTLDDSLRHPIWVSAHDDRHDEEWFKPVDSTEGVTSEVLQLDAPIITLRIAGTDLFATGYYDRTNDRLFCVAFHVDGKWAQPDEPYGLAFPVELESIPAILGKAGARFVLVGPGAPFAERAE
jgi:hypothetical protein